MKVAAEDILNWVVNKQVEVKKVAVAVVANRPMEKVVAAVVVAENLLNGVANRLTKVVVAMKKVAAEAAENRPMKAEVAMEKVVAEVAVYKLDVSMKVAAAVVMVEK